MLTAIPLALPLLRSPQLSPINSTEPIQQSVIAETRTLQALRVKYAPGAADPPGPHVYDVIIVPIEDGLAVEVEGRRVSSTTPGAPVLISRGAPHRIWNPSSHPVAFVSAHVMNDAAPLPERGPAGTPPRLETTGATLIHSISDKYVRVDTYRFEWGGKMEAAAGDVLDSLFVLAARADVARRIGKDDVEGISPAGEAFLIGAGVPFTLRNRGEQPFEILRIGVVGSR